MPEKPVKIKGRYTNEFKNTIRDEWITGKYTITALAQKYGIQRQETIWGWMKLHHWDEYRSKVREKVDEKLIDKAATALARQQEVGMFLQGKGLKVLKETPED